MKTLFTTRWSPGGASTMPYAAANVSDGVGDDPAAVAANRAAVAEVIGVPADHVVWMRQVHGTRVAVVDGPQPEPLAGTDAVVTTTPGLALAALAADCVPVLLWARAGEAVAAAHAGRRGIAAGVIPRVVAVMRQLGLPPVAAALGPAIGPCCYAVGADVHDEVCRAARSASATTTNGERSLDLRAAAQEQLAAAGVADIATDDTCTACDSAYFSHRRDGVTGRQAAVIVR